MATPPIGYSLSEATLLVGRVIARAGRPYTVTSASTCGAVCVWDPQTHTFYQFDSRETFEHWMFDTPVPAAASSADQE